MVIRNALLLLLALCAALAAQTPAPWKFAVSGDSRNCGDIVMPAIAAGVRQNQAEFYWHLGDFRAIYTFDEDLVPPASLNLPTKPLNIIDYLTGAWPDFIAHQLDAFGTLPIFLSPGNHETIPPATREAYLLQFADWLDVPTIRNQRLRDDPTDHKLRSYYHWIDRGVDFIALDNASRDQFDLDQLKWLRDVVGRDAASPEVKTIVVGMHAALPGSVGFAHSMSDSAQGDVSGRQVYQGLLQARDVAHKNVYVLASHSHFYMEDVYQTDVWKGHVLPGWIVGTAGAVRYRLPSGTVPGPKAMTDVYGYMIGTVAADGTISFSFQKLSVDDLLRANQGRLPESLVHWCDEQNKQ
ncbi:MAG TPA: metallophosphoesterase [Bryobacteraceae bacterium]|nr:metallophosphoesterase [Bryobacteraceae bacterium]